MWRRTIAPTLFLAAALGCGGEDPPPGAVEGARRPEASLREAREARAEAAREIGAGGAGKRILFGDLHVHTTYSIDAFISSLPFYAGEGAHPPADACDFARYCSALDFFSLNDHAEALTTPMWQSIKQSLRECNARAGDPADPDLVAFTGWEWTQVGPTPELHYGHKNVIFPGLEDDELPSRVITSLPQDVMERTRGLWFLPALQGIRLFGLGPYADFLWLIEQLAGLPSCDIGVDTRELPLECRENAPTPRELFEKLDQWGFPTLVIPHGLAWGLHAPPGADLDLQLSRAMHSPGMQRLIEVHSGHGNSEEHRDWKQVEGDTLVCPEPTAEFLACCWQAGEIMRDRCGELPGDECERRVEEARELALHAGVKPHWVFPDAPTEAWLDCDQCRDCFKPAMSLRPGMTAQYGAAIGRFDEGPDPLRFRWGFIASSDNHTARPGTGYKQVERLAMTDSRGVASEWRDRLMQRALRIDQEDPQRATRFVPGPQGFRSLLDNERVASFMYPGGLVAVHSQGRDRQAIWDALQRKEVYGTSGPRILLWFDLSNGPSGRVPMGGEAVLSAAPRFEVHAVGSFVQKPGCPEESLQGLSSERLERLCRGECYHPSDERHPIAAIEIVRIRPQSAPDEDVAGLIEDPWLRFECPSDPKGCSISFEDAEYPESGRSAVYYARALQVETPAINAGNLRTTFADGAPVGVSPCFGSYKTDPDDPCLAGARERAWSSPIYVDPR